MQSNVKSLMLLSDCEDLTVERGETLVRVERVIAGKAFGSSPDCTSCMSLGQLLKQSEFQSGGHVYMCVPE